MVDVRRAACVLLLLVLGCSCMDAQSAPKYNGPRYERQVVMIPVRDGVKLYTVILRPAGSAKSGAALPFLMARTPYGVEENGADFAQISKPELAASGYIFVYQDIRGKFGSEGMFTMNHPLVAHKTSKDIDESTDAYDTVAWLIKNIPNNNGRVGVFGVSYPGFLTMMAGLDHHPAVKAISPQAPMTNIWIGDDFFHNGAFRETYGFDYVQELEGQKTDDVVSSKEDQYTFFLKHGNFEGAAKSAHMENLPTAKIFLTQPAYTPFWQAMAVEPHLGVPEVPTLEVGGYWDQEDMWGTQEEYKALHAHEPANDPLHHVYMVLGPWNHGQWGHAGGSESELSSKYGHVSFGDHKTVTEYRQQFETPFFELYLKGKPGFDLKDTASFRTGENQWHRYASWPPVEGFHTQRAYLDENKTLRFAAPKGMYDAVAASYISDPADPIPFRHRPIQSTYGEGSWWRPWLVEDQRFVSDRKDLANFMTAPLQHDVTVTGDVKADIFAATTGSDGDWVVKLIDEYPPDAPNGQGGYQLMVAEEILRGRYRESLTDPQAVKPGEVVEYKWSLHGTDHTFLKGHRMLVEVQSTWFPLYDRNPQTFVPNIMTAPAEAYRPETITIYGSEKYPSHLEFPVSNDSVLP